MTSCEPVTQKRTFFRQKSTVGGIIGSAALTLLLFLLLAALFTVRSAASLLQTETLTQTVSAVLNSDTLREDVANTIQKLAPENTVTREQIETALNDEEVQGAIAQFGDDWIDAVLDPDRTEINPVDALLDALEDPERAALYSEALDTAMHAAGVTDEDFYNAAVLLAEELEAEPPAKDSSNLTIAAEMLKNNRDKLEIETRPIVELAEENQQILAVAGMVCRLSGSLVFLLVNAVLLLVFYGGFLLLNRHPAKPFLYLGMAYLAVGFLLCTIGSFDPILLFDLQEPASALAAAVLYAFTRGGIPALLTGTVLIVLRIGIGVGYKLLQNRKAETVPTETATEPV